MKKGFQVTFMGASGSSAGNYYQREVFGNNTSCIFVQVGERNIVLDLGTGSVSLVPYIQEIYEKEWNTNELDVFLGHFHYDHIEGFLFFKPLFDGKKHRIYGKKMGNRTTRQIFSEYLRTPFIPISIEQVEENVEFKEINEGEKILLDDEVTVETCSTHHPGGCLAYKISYHGKSLVYMLDHEHGSDQDLILENFCKQCDLLIYDGTFTEQEYSTGKYTGWGHSTYLAGVRFAKRAEVKQIAFSHHAPWRTDRELLRIGDEVKKVFPKSYVVTEGMQFDLLQESDRNAESFFQELEDYVDYEEILEICKGFCTERDVNQLLEKILLEAMRITHCDGGTIYFYNGEALEFKIMLNYSLDCFKGRNGEVIELPPVPMTEQNVCSYAAIHRKSINIKDVSKEIRFDSSGTLKYDCITKYHTQSLLVHPLINNRGELVGVMQLINSLDKNGKVIPFDEGLEQVTGYLANHAAISLTNAIYVMEIENLLHSMVEVMTTAIDQRSPYTANHTKNVAMYTSLFLDYINCLPVDDPFPKRFTENEKRQLIMAAMLHDVGKIATPTQVINKSTRLASQADLIQQRLKWIDKCVQVDYYEGKISEQEKQNMQNKIEDARTVMESINKAVFLNDEMIEAGKRVGCYIYHDEAGETIPFFTEYEKECLQIVKGTFTPKEREIMEQHVDRTRELLEKIPFLKEYQRVTQFAIQHHETLDGKGYPLGLTEKDIPLESRILALIDIFDALTAKDRPYKDVISVPRAYEILGSMVEEGKLDQQVYTYFKESGIGRIAVLSQQKGETVQW